MNTDIKLKKIILLIIIIMVGLSCASFSSFATDSSFETSISAFPESYKPYLRQLHEKYPKWSFVPFNTGLDFNSAVSNESGDKSLVTNASGFSNTFKSMESTDYNKSTGTYIQKDSGFVTANRLCVSYYLDPRNFLTESSIFQFELLSFDSSFTTSTVEAVLNGTFMSNAYMNYYDSNGKYVKSTVKYSTAIYNAGKKYNINPCFLASKIKNEVGSSGSSSTSGRYSGYLGIYNFYNIGASDGSGAIARGLAWAGSGSTYSRPWTSPEKSIAGGAEFLASTYISQGQFTGYLQKFNVNADSSYDLYTHQYMTNTCGAVAQGYSTYLSYAKSGSLSNVYVFSIPVFKNMPSQDVTTSQSLSLADSKNQYGYIDVSACNVRTGPSTSNAKLSTTLSYGDYVKIEGKYFTDSDYYLDVVQYTFWYKIQFTKNSVTYTGYVPESFVSFSTTSYISLGTYSLNALTSNNAIKYGFLSSDSSIAKVNADNTVTFLKNGTVYISVYDSKCHYDKIKFKVVSTTADSLKATGVTAKVSSSSVTVSCNKISAAGYYDFNLIDYTTGALISRGIMTSNSYTFSAVPAGKVYKIIVRAMTNTSTSARKFAQFSDPIYAVVAPEKVSSLKATTSTSGITLSWSKVSACTGYFIYVYNPSTSAYSRIGSTSASVNSFKVPQQYAVTSNIYRVRAYSYLKPTIAYGSASATVSATLSLAKTAAITESSATISSYKLNWKAVSGATGYIVSRYNAVTKAYDKLADLTSLSYTVTGLKAGQTDIYAVTAYNKNGSSIVYGTPATFYGAALPGNITGLEYSNLTGSSLTLKWTAATGATSYIIYKLNTENEKYEIFATSTSNSIDLFNLSQNTIYNFIVTAVVNTKSVKVEGESSADIVAKTKLSEINGFGAINITPNSYTLSWEKNPIVEKYQLYQFNKSSGEYDLLTTTTALTYDISGLEPATGAKYKIRCYKTENKSVIYSDFSDEKTVYSAVPTVTGLNLAYVSDSSFTLTWDGNAFANAYYVYRRISSGNYEKVATVTNNSYTASGLSNSYACYYRIIAVNIEKDVIIKSAYSGAIKGVTLPKKVSSVKASDVTSTSATLTWTKIDNATGYRVYFYNSSKNKYEKKYDVSSNYCKISGLSTGKSSAVLIRAYVNSISNYYGDYCSTFTFTTAPGKISKIAAISVTMSSYIISWSKSEKATSYRIYKYDSSKKKYVYFATTVNPTYTVKSQPSASAAVYKVYPMIIDSTGKAVAGSSSAALYVSTLPAKVSGVTASTKSTTSITLKWTKTSSTSFYQIYLYNSTTKKYQLKGTSTSNSFKVTSLKSGKKYYFKVRAVKTFNGINYYASASNAYSCSTK